ncbi:unnamed protein product [Chondrus crispus]|uniref:Uncharacterized protein n=1 Tax=Chondrus crispus TaxID=2769 RepID=R7QQM9_CHOCR|nr:unnamed protein product [Chondrus crispus]CDF39796.1 unnamed protein product [Chondrus crispus]|eukprot:XP_005710090.1 unnamed protein product [Chondrus crispus]
MRANRISSEPAAELLSRLSSPQKAFSAVHVTGSKGKGSVATMVTAALLHAPLFVSTVGTYGSPHVERFNERIRINGRSIPDDDLANALGQVLDVREQEPEVRAATVFDVVCASAMLEFKRIQARWAVIEVGLGGRLDSTNVLDAPVAVITNVHLEHKEIIGPTRKDIAYEKAGIIAPGAHVVCGMSRGHELANIFVQEAASKSPPATIQFCAPEAGHSLFEHNLMLSRAAVQAVARREGVAGMADNDLLPKSLAEEAMSNLPARQEMFTVASGAGETDTPVRVLLDGAHVPESVEMVLRESSSGRPRVILYGSGVDKDVEAIGQLLHDARPLHVVATAAGVSETYMPADDLAERIRKTGNTPVTAVGDADEALQAAIDLANSLGADLAILGSLHIAGRVRPSLRARQDHFRSNQQKPRFSPDARQQ